MRELYIGGYAQGKLDYVRRRKEAEGIEITVVDCGAWKTAQDQLEAMDKLRAATMRDGVTTPDTGVDAASNVVFDRFHLWVRNMILADVDEKYVDTGDTGERDVDTACVDTECADAVAEHAFTRFLEQYPNWIIISDEVGNGIVPMEKEERAYREVLGRILIEAASKADRVERVICGLGQRIK